MSPSWIWSDKITNARVAPVGYNHFISNKGEWNNCFSEFSNRVLPPIFISTILQSGKFLNLARYFPHDVKLRLLAHSQSFLANQKARNAIVGAENLLNFNIHILESVNCLFFKNLWIMMIVVMNITNDNNIVVIIMSFSHFIPVSNLLWSLCIIITSIMHILQTKGVTGSSCRSWCCWLKKLVKNLSLYTVAFVGGWKTSNRLRAQN